ncbi:nitrogenase component 1 [Thiocystis violascens]|nr:nitrogenase component 1 [Thiocystis violascens]
MVIWEKGEGGTINPIFTCQPAGAQYASIGIKDCIGIVHGGQGCVMFVRLLISQHLKESFEIASSSVHEDGAVFGALDRVEQAVDVLLMRYPHVKVVPIITTCSTEVIGDDVDGVARKLNEGLLQEKYAGREVHLIPVHTPSFVGSMVSGYDVAVRDFVKHFATRGEPNGKLNLITGWANPGDIKALKHLLAEMEIEATVLFEIETFDSPLMPDGNSVSHGSTTIADLQVTANALGAIALNRYEGDQAAKYLEFARKLPSRYAVTDRRRPHTDHLRRAVADVRATPHRRRATAVGRTDLTESRA